MLGCEDPMPNNSELPIIPVWLGRSMYICVYVYMYIFVYTKQQKCVIDIKAIALEPRVGEEKELKAKFIFLLDLGVMWEPSIVPLWRPEDNLQELVFF